MSLFAPNGTKEKDRPLHAKGHTVMWLVTLVLLAVMWAISMMPGLVEKVYTEGLGQLLARFLAAISGVFSFSLGEILLAALILWILAGLSRAVYYAIRRERRGLNALACGLLQLVTATLVLTCSFYLAWGLNYARAGLATRLNWEHGVNPGADRSLDDIDPEELARLCEELVEATNAAYAQAHGCEDIGRPSAPASLKRVDKIIDRAYERVADYLGLHPSFAVSRGLAKPVLISKIMCYGLLAGLYCPWTGEANYNRLAPGAKLPHIIAHEKAHQRAVASEDEANFFGYLACASSDDPYVRYSGYLFAQQQLLRELRRVDKDRAKELIARRYRGVRRDIEAEREFWTKHQGKLSEMSHTVNDAYLKANRVKGGTLSYQMSARLLVLFARQHSGSCVVQDAADPSATTPTDAAAGL